MYPINSVDYWEDRFASGDWNANQGKKQTAYFYRLLMNMMPQWAKNDIAQNNYDIVDLGCAEGQGLPIVAAELGTNITGVDFSDHAIQNASVLYPSFQFEVGDIWKYNQEHDVTIASNVIEHFEQPFVLLKQIAGFTRKYMIVMVPLEETDLMPEHKVTFFYNNIPTAVDKFQLIYFAEHDCRDDEEQLFLGKQIFLLYSCDREISQKISIESSSSLLQMMRAQKNEQKKFEKAFASLNESLKGEMNGIASELAQLKNTLNEQLCVITKRVSDKSKLHVDNIVAAIDQKNLEIQTVNAKNEHLVALYNDIDGKYTDLVNSFNNLNDAYGKVVKENFHIKNSRTYKFANLTWKIANKLHLIGGVRLLLSARYVGLKQALKQRKIQRQQNYRSDIVQRSVLSDTQESIAANDPCEQEQIENLNYRKSLYSDILDQEVSATAKEIAKIITTRSHKGIVVYPHAVHWEPMQRPHHFLRAFAEEGFLCFFCEESTECGGYEEKYPNVFMVNGEENLLWGLQSKCPIVMVTFHMQAAFVDALPNKIIWFDLLDNLEFFAGSDFPFARTIYSKLISDATVVSYSADNLKKYLPDREDALKLNNGVMLSDFLNINQSIQVDIMEQIKQSGKPIIGYYGAIEEWFDKDAIRILLEQTDFEIVLIGHVGIDLDDLKHNRLHILGMISYKELGNYAKYFDLALIPFIKNSLTDSVSPVKFYEYVAQGIPVLSSDIQEMRQYVSDQVCIYHNREELVSLADMLCMKSPDVEALKEIAYQNTWKKRTESILEAIVATPRGLCAFADFRGTGGVAVETVTFFKYDGTTYYSGGAERYLLDLHEVCSELNVPYRVYQYGEYNWVRYYDDVEVVGMQSKLNDVNLYEPPLVKEMNEIFSRETAQNSEMNIYSPFYILSKKMCVPSVGISHGISWDSEFNHYTEGNTFWQSNKNIISAADFCDQMISVDTNTCNWFQTLDYNTGRKIHYIPNYVDNAEFAPREDYLAIRDKVVVVYPRRLYGARGLYVVLDVLDDILSKYPNVEFHFVGKGFERDTKHVEKKIAKWGKRIQWYSKAPNQMHEVYKMADISLIPTMYSEGTSLSCLEALSSGNAVIATRVGGLTDLILSDYNGKLVEPTSESIKDALFDLLEHPEKMQLLKKNAVETARAFSKAKWKAEWKKILSGFASETGKTTPPLRCMIQLHSDADLTKADTLNSICEYLQNGWYVYVACKNNPMRFDSYKRLQFIDLNEDLYFKPEKTLCL